MSDETDTTSEVAWVLEFGRVWAEATMAYHRAVEEAFLPLLEMGRERAAQHPQIATQEPAGATQDGSGDSRASGGLDGAMDACGAKSEPFLIRDSDQKPVHYLVKTCNLPAGHGRPHHWPVLTFATPGFTEDAP